ncbi:MAG: S41 family peptidase [Candidatus Niyogibacteria bacterium]|nr:S41 family peptidase [Candidatus Niyogibacteria bacterium]
MKRNIFGKILALIFILFFIQYSNLAEAGDKTLMGQDDPLITEIKTILENNYLEPERLKKIDWNRINKKEEWLKEIFSNLDPHSHYLNPSDFKMFLEIMKGEYGGIGIELKFKKKSDQEEIFEKMPSDSCIDCCIDFLVIINSVYPDNPAGKAGLLPEDILIKINNKDINGWCLSKIAEELKGKTGSAVEITVLRENKELIFTITREIVKINPITSFIFEDPPSKIKVGYIKIKNFNVQGTFHNLLNNMSELTKKGIENFIIDLRANHGGMLSEGVDVADIFLDQNFSERKIITSVQDKNGVTINEFFSFSRIKFISCLVVLVDAKSASSAEIVAAALQDHKKAIIVGLPTFGKASVQKTFHLQDGGGILVTIGRYFRPNGQTLQGYGVIPDIIIQKEAAKEEKPAKREKDLEMSLKPVGDKPPAPFADLPKKYQDDFQLIKSLEIIRSFEIMKKNN